MGAKIAGIVFLIYLIGMILSLGGHGVWEVFEARKTLEEIHTLQGNTVIASISVFMKEKKPADARLFYLNYKKYIMDKVNKGETFFNPAYIPEIHIFKTPYDVDIMELKEAFQDYSTFEDVELRFNDATLSNDFKAQRDDLAVKLALSPSWPTKAFNSEDTKIILNNINESLSQEKEIASYDEFFPDGRMAFSTYILIKNTKEAELGHGSDRKYIGILRVSREYVSIIFMVLRTHIVTAAGMLLFGLLIFLVTTLIMKGKVGRPLEQLNKLFARAISGEAAPPFSIKASKNFQELIQLVNGYSTSLDDKVRSMNELSEKKELEINALKKETQELSEKVNKVIEDSKTAVTSFSSEQVHGIMLCINISIEKELSKDQLKGLSVFLNKSIKAFKGNIFDSAFNFLWVSFDNTKEGAVNSLKSAIDIILKQSDLGLEEGLVSFSFSIHQANLAPFLDEEVTTSGERYLLGSEAPSLIKEMALKSGKDTILVTESIQTMASDRFDFKETAVAKLMGRSYKLYALVDVKS